MSYQRHFVAVRIVCGGLHEGVDVACFAPYVSVMVRPVRIVAHREIVGIHAIVGSRILVEIEFHLAVAGKVVGSEQIVLRGAGILGSDRIDDVIVGRRDVCGGVRGVLVHVYAHGDPGRERIEVDVGSSVEVLHHVFVKDGLLIDDLRTVRCLPAYERIGGQAHFRQHVRRNGIQNIDLAFRIHDVEV